MAAALSLLQSEASNATVDALHRANKLQDLIQACWTDGALGNRPKGGSTGGFLCGISTPELEAGRMTPVSMVGWSSQKLDRVCRSSFASEVQACGNVVDFLWF